MHRLAPDDLTATLVEDGGWRQIALPLIAVQENFYYNKRSRVLMLRTPGDLLNPGWLTADAVEQLRASLPPHPSRRRSPATPLRPCILGP
jgi:hypothetical protein